MSAYSLRPHHGLCLHYFRGEGYSEAFVANMQEIVDNLSQNPIIDLIDGADSVCRTCPNRIGESDCACDAKVLHYDQMVVDFCGLTPSTKLTWNEFSDRVNKYIFSKNLRETICGDCQWSDICR